MKQVVVGLQSGDEGKGKIVDFIAKHSSLVVRFSGGANAGHTIVTKDGTFKLHLIPSGIIYPNTKVVLGTGMVIDTEELIKELDILTNQGIDWKGRVFISDRAHYVLPVYKDEDIKKDRERKNPIGTTGRGIGIAYEHKAARNGYRFCEKLSYLDGIEIINLPYFMEWYADEDILFEGAQGALIDLDTGTYPYVSSGSAISAGASSGGGIGVTDINRVFGVFKAYQSKVGNGPFPTKFTDEEMANNIREIGREYGVTTGRPRDVGYLDLVALKYACLVNGVDSLAITHLDVLDTWDEIKVCTEYEIDGVKTKMFPSSIKDLEKVVPIYKTLDGWNNITSNAKKITDLPLNAALFVDYISNYVNIPTNIISVGCEREQTIVAGIKV